MNIQPIPDVIRKDFEDIRYLIKIKKGLLKPETLFASYYLKILFL